jgi:protein phosphatase
MHLAFETPSVIVLAGPTGIGKSSWAARLLDCFVCASDEARRMITDDEGDQSATEDAFALVGTIARLRLSHQRPVVIDSTALRAKDRSELISIAQAANVPAYLVVFDGDADLCSRGQRSRKRRVPDTVIERHIRRLEDMRQAQARGQLAREGFARVDWLSRDQANQVDGIDWVSSTARAIDVIGDIHGCTSELLALLAALGYQRRATGWFHPQERLLAFVGDLTDRGPASVEALRLVDKLVADRIAMIAAIGNHDWKLYRGLVLGRDVTHSNGMQATLDEIEHEQAEEEVVAILHRLFDQAPAHSVFDNGRLIVTHGAVYRSMKGHSPTSSRRDALSSLGLFGETTGETLDSGHPERIYTWTESWNDPKETVVFGHDVVGLAPKRIGPQKNIIGLDTGCAFGGRLSALRWPEQEIVAVGALRRYSDDHHPMIGGAPSEPLVITHSSLEHLSDT